MKFDVGDRVRDRVSGQVMFIETFISDGKIATCSWRDGHDRRTSDFSVEDLDRVGPPPQVSAASDYDPFKQKD
jgi:uncharacterized protein YodC (DUF2158 family)